VFRLMPHNRLFFSIHLVRLERLLVWSMLSYVLIIPGGLVVLLVLSSKKRGLYDFLSCYCRTRSRGAVVFGLSLVGVSWLFGL